MGDTTRFGKGTGGGGDTGRTFEARLFGIANMNFEFQMDLLKIPKQPNGRFDDRRPEIERQVFDAFKRHYNGAKPNNIIGERGETSLSTDLRIAVENALGFTDQNDELKFYTAVDTVVDHDFGTDAFFELTDPKTKVTVRVKLDATLAQKERPKADVIIGELPDAVQEPDEYEEVVDEHGARIASLLQRRLNDENNRRTPRRA